MERDQLKNMGYVEIEKQVKTLHKEFSDLTQKYYAPESSTEEKRTIRKQLAPIVERERELRKEYVARVGQGLKEDKSMGADRATDTGYSR